MLVLPFPWWIMLIILFICYSGYKAFRAMQAEKRIKQHRIKWEGQIYMERLQKERARRSH